NEHAMKVQPELAKGLASPTPAGGAPSAGAGIRYGSGQAQIEQVRLLDQRGRLVESFEFGESVVVEVAVRALTEVANLHVHFHIPHQVGVGRCGPGPADEGIRSPALAAGSLTRVRFRFTNTLRAGNYGVTVTLTRLPDILEAGGITLDHISAVAAFAVVGD